MKYLFLILFVLNALLHGLRGEDPVKEKASGRESRKFDSGFGEYGPYYNPDDSGEIAEPPVYSDAGQRPEAPRPERKSNDLKGITKYYDENAFYTPYSPVPYKGYPYYGKGSTYPSGPPLSMTPEQMVEMMNAVDLMKDSQKEQGFLSKILADPKSILVAAIIPVSIMLASFIPLLVNYFMNGTSDPSVLSTVASSKLARSLSDFDNLHLLLKSLDKYERKLQDYECFEEGVCHIITDQSAIGDDDYIKTAVKALAKFVKAEWIGHPRIANALSAIKQKNCSNVCDKTKMKLMKKNSFM